MKEALYTEKMAGLYNNFYCKSEQTCMQVNFLVKLFKKHKARKILDIACGTGRHAIALAGKGFSVTGVDASHAMINQARKNASMLDCQIKFKIQDIRKLSLKEKFDAAFIMYGSLAYVKTNKDAINALRSVARCLKKNGLIIIEDDNPWQYIVTGQLKKKTTEEIKNGKKRLVIKHVNRLSAHNNYMDVKASYNFYEGKNKIFTAKDKGYASLRILTQNDMELLLKLSGFRPVKFYSSFNGKAFSKKTHKKLIAVALKK